MELAFEPGSFERRPQPVDAIGNEERRPFLPLREEVAHGAIERSRQPHGRALVGDDGKRSVNRAHGGCIAAEHTRARLIERHVVDQVQLGLEQIDDGFDGTMHEVILGGRGLGG